MQTDPDGHLHKINGVRDAVESKPESWRWSIALLGAELGYLATTALGKHWEDATSGAVTREAVAAATPCCLAVNAAAAAWGSSSLAQPRSYTHCVNFAGLITAC